MTLKIYKLITCILFLTIPLQAAWHNPYPYDEYDEVVDPSMRLAGQAMGAFFDAMKSYIIYTAMQNIPGTKESGVGYYYDYDTQQMKRTFFYRIGQGYPRQTNKALDFKINGNGFFVIHLPGGYPAYTRDGRFDIDRSGRLVTQSERFPVMGESGEIFLPSKAVDVDEHGVIRYKGEIVDTFKVIAVKDKRQLDGMEHRIFFFTEEQRREWDNLFTEPKYTVQQGYVEDSSVTKAYIGLVPEWKNGHEASVKMVKAFTKNMSSAIQFANP